MTEAARLEGIIALVGAAAAVGGLKSVAKAADGAQAGLDGVEAGAKRANDHTSALGASLMRTGDSMQGAGKKLTKFATLPMLALGAATLKVGSDFSAQMSKVEAKADATGSQMDQMRALALKLGADTAFSATEAAQGMEILAAAGMKSNDVMAAMPGLLDAAAASGEGVADTANVIANTLAQFNLEASDSGRIADVLAKASNETQGSIASMGEALKFAGTGADELGFSLEQTTGMVSMMVKAGIDGGNAGTAFRMGMQRVAQGALASERALSKLGKVSPALRDIWKSSAPVPDKIRQMAGEFQKLDGKSRAVAASLIFGTEASTGMLQVMKGGPAQIQRWTDSMNKAHGAAKKMADTNLDNLKGDVEALRGSVESAMIGMFEQADGPLRSLTQSATGAVNAFGAMGPAGQSAALGMGVLAAGAGPALIGAGAMVRAWGEVNEALAGTAALSRLAAFALNPYVLGAVALGGVVLGVASIVHDANEEDKRWRETGLKVADAVNDRRAALERLRGAQSTARTATKNMRDAEDQYGKDSAQFRAAAQSRRDALREVAKAQQDVADATKRANAATHSSGGAKGGQAMTAGERGTVTSSLVRVQEELSAAYKRQITEGGRLQRQMETNAATIKSLKSRNEELSRQFDQGKISGKQFADAFEANSRAIRDAEKESKRLSDRYSDMGRKIEKLTQEKRQLQQALGGVSDASRAAADRIKDMANTPANLRAAKDLLKDMTAMERRALFGTANINKILSGVGKTKTASDWATDFMQQMQRVREEARNPITVAVNLDVGQLQSFNPVNALGGSRGGGKGGGKGAGRSSSGKAGQGKGAPASTGLVDNAKLNGDRFDSYGSMTFLGSLAAAPTLEGLVASATAQSTNDTGYVTGQTSAAQDRIGELLKRRRKLLETLIPAARNRVKTTRAKLKAANQAVVRAERALNKAKGKEQITAAKKVVGTARTRQVAAAKAYEKAQDTLQRLTGERDEGGDELEQLAGTIAGNEQTLTDAKNEAEELRREALGLESLADEQRRNAINAIRAANGLPLLKPGDTLNADGTISAGGSSGSGSSDLAAQLEQARQRAESEAAKAALAQRELGVLTGAGDLGRGAGNAWDAARGAGITLVVNSMTGYDPRIQQTVADVANSGLSSGANADIFYSGRQ